MTIKEYIKQAIEYLKTGKATPEFIKVDKYVGDVLEFTIGLTIIIIVTLIIVKKKKKKRKIIEEYKKTNYYNETHQNKDNVDKNKGDYGEYLISLELEKTGEYHKTVYNLNIPTQTRKTEIDIVYICNSGIYVIESKNYSGYIFGDTNSNQWTQTLPSPNGINKSEFD